MQHLLRLAKLVATAGRIRIWWRFAQTSRWKREHSDEVSLLRLFSPFLDFLSVFVLPLSSRSLSACLFPSVFFSPVFLFFAFFPVFFVLDFLLLLLSLALVGVSVKRNEHVGAAPSHGVQYCQLSFFLWACNFRSTCLRISFSRSLFPCLPIPLSSSVSSTIRRNN